MEVKLNYQLSDGKWYSKTVYDFYIDNDNPELDKLNKEIELYTKWKTTSNMDNYALTDLFICKVSYPVTSGWLYVPAYYIDGNFVKLSDGEAIKPDYFKLLNK